MLLYLRFLITFVVKKRNYIYGSWLHLLLKKVITFTVPDYICGKNKRYYIYGSWLHLW